MSDSSDPDQDHEVGYADVDHPATTINVVAPETVSEAGPRGVTPPSISVLRAVTPLVVVAVLTAAVAGGFGLWITNLNSRVASASTAIDIEQTKSLDLASLWSGILGLIASGVGQEVATPAQVSVLAGKARSDSSSSFSNGSRTTALRRRANESRQKFIDMAEKSVERSDGDPIALGNDLSKLRPAYESSMTDGLTYRTNLETARSVLRSNVDRFGRLIAIALIAGLVASVLVGLRFRRRLSGLLDEPALSTADALSRFADGDTSARSNSRTRSGLGAISALADEDLATIAARIDELQSSSDWGERSRMIFDALDQADDEPAAYKVVERALAMVDDDHRPVELLMSDRGSNKLRSVASDATVESPGCNVDTTNGCIALRRGQVSVFSSSRSINACPMLDGRPGGPCSSVCVPVTVSGRPVGVFNMVGPEFETPDTRVVDRLVTLSVQLGNRLASLRTLESTRKEASTDGLTGLPNRRTLQTELSSLLDSETSFVTVLADLDKFKVLNDTFGHEVGDKALQLFANVSRDNVRGNDLVARVGGEEFVFVYPNMSVETSIEAIGRLRQALARAVLSSRLPPFTCSFGVTVSSVGTDAEAILRVADAGLLTAKELGGDQAVFADADMVDSVFGNSDHHFDLTSDVTGSETLDDSEVIPSSTRIQPPDYTPPVDESSETPPDYRRSDPEPFEHESSIGDPDDSSGGV